MRWAGTAIPQALQCFVQCSIPLLCTGVCCMSSPAVHLEGSISEVHLFGSLHSVQEWVQMWHQAAACWQERPGWSCCQGALSVEEESRVSCSMSPGTTRLQSCVNTSSHTLKGCSSELKADGLQDEYDDSYDDLQPGMADGVADVEGEAPRQDCSTLLLGGGESVCAQTRPVCSTARMTKSCSSSQHRVRTNLSACTA